MKAGRGRADEENLVRINESHLPIEQIQILLNSYNIFSSKDPQNPFILHGHINNTKFLIQLDETRDESTNTKIEFFSFQNLANGAMHYLELNLPLNAESIFYRVNKNAVIDIMYRLFENLEYMVNIYNNHVLGHIPGHWTMANGMIYGLYNGKKVHIYQGKDDMGLGIECVKVANIDTKQSKIAFGSDDDEGFQPRNKIRQALDDVISPNFQTRVVEIPQYDENEDFMNAMQANGNRINEYGKRQR